MQQPSATPFIPCNPQWVASSSPSNIGAKMHKIGTGRRKLGKNVHMSAVNIVVFPSLSDTTSLSSSPIYSEPSTHPSSETSTLCSLSSSMKSLYPMLQETNVSLNSPRISANLNVKQQQEVIEFSPFIGRKFVLKLVSVWLCFPRQ